MPARVRSARAANSPDRNAGTQIVGMPRISANTSLGSEPPRFGRMAGSRPVVTAMDRRRPSDTGVARIEPARPEEFAPRPGHRHVRKAVPVQVPAQGGQDVAFVHPDHEPELEPRSRPRQDHVPGSGRIAGVDGQDGDGRPPEDPLGRRQAGLAPGRVDGGRARLRFDRAAGERGANGVGDAGGHPFGHPDRPIRSDDGGNRVGHADRGIGEQAAPVAGMVAALAGTRSTDRG